MWKPLGLAALLTIGIYSLPSTANGQTVLRVNGFYPRVIARGEDRQIIEATPIENRPYRPLHFYGNTVRRQYFRTGVVPSSPFRPFSRRGASNTELGVDWDVLDPESPVESGLPVETPADAGSSGWIPSPILEAPNRPISVYRSSVIEPTLQAAPAARDNRFIWPASAPRPREDR